MNKLFLGAAAVIALAAPSVAMAKGGYVEAGYQNLDGSVGATDVEGDGGLIGFGVSLGDQGLGFQVDGGVGFGDDATSREITAHVLTRSESYALGAFIGAGDNDTSASPVEKSKTAGIEGQWYMPRTTLDAALSYTDISRADVQLTEVAFGATHFLTDNFTINGSLAYGTGDAGANDADAWGAGVGTEYRFGSSPVSLLASYSYAKADDLDADAHVITVGVRLDLGTDSLLDRNRHGASFSGGALGAFSGLF